jgi:hypothetical protein
VKVEDGLNIDNKQKEKILGVRIIDFFIGCPYFKSE